MITVDFRRLTLDPGCCLLDIGCGTGRHSAEALRYPAIRVVAADRDCRDLRSARHRMRYHEHVGASAGADWALAAADIRALPFSAGAFDLVICSEVLEHVAHPREAAVELARVLKPGGELVVSVPRYLPERICWQLSEDYHRQAGGHVRIFRRGELRAMIEGLGLRCQGTAFAHALHTPYWWLRCLVGPQRQDCGSVRLYHRFLTWQILRRPRLPRVLERLLNPLLGKSMVLYFVKPAGAATRRWCRPKAAP
jgi:SAM-dependent methyltransferase